MEKRDQIVKLLKVTRMHIVLGGILAFILGALLGITAGGIFNPFTIVLCYFVVFFGDLSTHYSNDYFDANQDRLVVRRQLFSGRKILVENPNLRPLARWISLGYLIISISLAAVAVVFRVAPVELLIITVGANFLGWFYSAPPLRLVSRGLGELAIFLIWGPILVAGVYTVLAKGWMDHTWLVALAGVPFGLSVVSINIGKHIDKMEDDKKKGVGTWPVRIGEKAARYVTIASLVLIYLVIVYLIFVPHYFTPVMLIVLLAGKRLLLAVGVLTKPRPQQAPEGYPSWPTWFSAFCFYHNRMFGGLFILGLIVDTLLRIFVSGFWPLI